MMLHHTARRTAGAAGVDDARQIVARHCRHSGLSSPYVGIIALNHVGPLVHRQLAVLHRWLRLHSDDEFRLRRPQCRRHQCLCQLCSRNNHRPCGAVIQNMLMVAFGIGDVGRYGHASSRHDAQIGDTPFGTIFRNEHDPVALFQPKLAQRFGKARNLTRDLSPA